MRSIRSPGRNARSPANSLPSPERVERYRPTRPSCGRGEAPVSNTPGTGRVTNERGVVTVDQRYAAHGETATTWTRSIVRTPHRVDRTGSSIEAWPPSADAVTTPLLGRVSTQVSWSSTATARSTSADPSIEPRHTVASPSRSVVWPSESSKVGAVDGLVTADQAVMTANGVATTSRSGRRQIRAITIRTTETTNARKNAAVGCHGDGAGDGAAEGAGDGAADGAGDGDDIEVSPGRWSAPTATAPAPTRAPCRPRSAR